MSVPSRLLLLAGLLSASLSAAAQSRPGPAYFLRHPASEPRLGAMWLASAPVPAQPRVAPLPTMRFAEAPFPRYDLTGSLAFPPYDPYQNLPESFRKYTLPAVWAEPLPLQLLRSALAR